MNEDTCKEGAAIADMIWVGQDRGPAPAPAPAPAPVQTQTQEKQADALNSARH
jgi:hypothetical protein